MPSSFDFASVAVPFRIQPGLRRLAPGETQLTPNPPHARALREKMAVLGAFADDALLATPGFDAGPALDALAMHAAVEHPRAFAWDRDALRADALRLHWSADADGRVEGDGPREIGALLRSLAPEWRLPALICLAFAEDFAVVDGTTARIPWLAVCLPSHWAPEQKVGRHFNEVHAPVADNALLLAAGERLARLVTGPERWERFVWTVTREPRLHAHPKRADADPWPPDADADALAAQAWLRTERQTFVPLPDRRQAVFTILVETRPLDAAVTEAFAARQLHDALASMSDAVLAYRHLGDARDRLLDWLARRAGA